MYHTRTSDVPLCDKSYADQEMTWPSTNNETLQV